jgi:amidophosphoribosyltransferase
VSYKAETIRLHQLDEAPRDECGVVGITGVERASEMAFLSLYALQHRGQESAGICAIDGGVARLHKRLGLAAEVFDADVLEKLPGTTAVGHVRYSTAGGGQLANAQPIMVRYAEGDLTIAHNGNLTNAHDIRQRLVQEGAIFQTDSDSEVIIHLIARSRRDTIDGQIDDALTYLEGAFSLIISVNDTLFAVRDPRGFRPLVLGRKDGGFVVASETCALDIIGAKFIRDVYPGEVLKLRGSELTPMRHLQPALQQAPCIFELVYFARPDSKVFGVSVDRSRRAFGRQLAREHPVAADAVLAVPDSANSAALGFSEESGIPFELGLLRNHYVGRTFIRPSQADRDFSARVKYAPVREALEGRRIVVVDDSLVRGTTSGSLVNIIREAGAAEVHLRIASPPVRFPCYYGIDMPTREELMASRFSVEEIQKELGVDSLGYLSLEGMEVAAADAGPFCNACFSGNYPAPLVDIDKGLLKPGEAGCC